MHLNKYNTEDSKIFFEVVEDNLKKNIKLLVDGELEGYDEYELLGNLCYYIGLGILDFHKNPSNSNETRKNLVSSYQERLNRIRVYPETVSKILDRYRNTYKYSVSYWDNSNERNKNLVNKQIYSGDSFIIYPYVRKILDNAIFPVGFSKDVNEILSIKSGMLTYRHLLMVNNFIYNDEVIINYSVYDNLKTLQSLKSYNSNLTKASKYYSIQKYSIMFYELILTMQELLNSDKFVDKSFTDVINDIARTVNEEIDKESNNTVTEENQEDIERKLIQDYIDNSPLKAVTYSIIDEMNNRNNTDLSVDTISTGEQLFNIISDYENIEIADEMIMYLKQYKHKYPDYIFNLDSFDGIVNKSTEFSLFKSHLNVLFEKKALELKEKMEVYLQDIDDSVLNTVVTLINKTLKVMVVDGSEKKAYIHQQLLENGVFTYQQLHQMINLIEQCKIYGKDIKVYDKLKSYVNEQPIIKINFEKYEEVNKLNNFVYYLQTLKSLVA